MYKSYFTGKNINAKKKEEELGFELIQIVTVFSCRLQGKRENKAKEMIKELLKSDIGEES